MGKKKMEYLTRTKTKQDIAIKEALVAIEGMGINIPYPYKAQRMIYSKLFHRLGDILGEEHRIICEGSTEHDDTSD